MEPGSIVELDLLDSSCGQLRATSGAVDIAALDFGRVDQIHGPIGVVGAMPGDTLEIEILEFAPDAWGWTEIIPSFGLLADDFPASAYRVSTIPSQRAGRSNSCPGLRVPRALFCGVLGVSPATGSTLDHHA